MDWNEVWVDAHDGWLDVLEEYIGFQWQHLVVIRDGHWEITNNWQAPLIAPEYQDIEADTHLATPSICESSAPLDLSQEKDAIQNGGFVDGKTIDLTRAQDSPVSLLVASDLPDIPDNEEMNQKIDKDPVPIHVAGTGLESLEEVEVAASVTESTGDWDMEEGSGLVTGDTVSPTAVEMNKGEPITATSVDMV